MLLFIHCAKKPPLGAKVTVHGHGPLAIYVKLWVAHAPGMPGTLPPLPRVSDPDMHHGTCVTHVPWCIPGSLTRSFLRSRWRGKRSRHSRPMRNSQFYISGKRPMMAYVDTSVVRYPWHNFKHCSDLNIFNVCYLRNHCLSKHWQRSHISTRQFNPIQYLFALPIMIYISAFINGNEICLRIYEHTQEIIWF